VWEHRAQIPWRSYILGGFAFVGVGFVVGWGVKFCFAVDRGLTLFRSAGLLQE
jgi:hypothetical protein